MTIEPSQSIPVEKGWPLLGILPKLLKGDPFGYLKNIMMEVGDLVELNIGPQKIYLVSNPDYLQRILRDNYQNYIKPDMFYKAGRQIVGNGLALSSGDFWLRQRRMIQPHLHRKQLSYLFLDMVDTVSSVVDGWGEFAKNNTEIEFSEKMAEITINTTVHTMFGKGTLPETEIGEIGRRITRMSKFIGETVYSTILPNWFPIPGHKEFQRDLNGTKETVNHIIAKCRENKEASASLAQMLINSVDEESHEQMTEQQLFDEIMTIFIAGYETTSTALTWFPVAIQNYPDVLAKLHNEIDQVLGTQVPSFEDIPRLIYTRQVFMEVLRMYTPFPFLPRSLTQADQLGNFTLPAGSLLLVFYDGVHHNPHVWENPEVFDPERFTPERMANQHPFAYVPFSAGPRKCAGDELALLEGTLIISMLLQKYDINLLPNQTFIPGLGSTMHPGHGVKASFSIRAKS